MIGRDLVMAEQLFVSGEPGAEASELAELGHRVLFDGQGVSVNIPGIVIDRKLLIEYPPPNQTFVCVTSGG